MSEHFNLGVYQLDNGNWAWRFTKTVNDKRVNRKGTKDIEGNPLRSQKAAIRARERAMLDFEAQLNTKPNIRMTLSDVFKEYSEHSMKGKAYSTIRKQNSLWKNHICEKFGSRFVDDISVGEINDYLAELYYVEGRAYGYVEGFLKVFYLLFGQAYSHNYINSETYNKLCVNKDIRITMPKMKIDEDTDIVAFSPEEINQLDEYFSGTNAETAYLLGRMCGLRINETYGIKWQNVDLDKGTIIIDRQMQYQDGLIKLVSLKTRNARRTIYLNDKIKQHLQQAWQQRLDAEKNQKDLRKQNQTIITDIDGELISSTELVNCLPNGKIQTVNSMKFHSRTLKEKGINFKYHFLRHTYGTQLANMNTPTHILCNQMGHASGKVTERYYLAVSKAGIDILLKNINHM
ncbi:tyrosine-type recombinase/integrase [Oribacterium sp. P6A1]|uniref:tyrosine-type recombinase/integrase n=1 Tax=Oribacterium sp. P6A1 TaxID=1410612 RepID=UPI000563D65F|nr:site-specific integrase [Oribacterium sp. P6A1]